MVLLALLVLTASIAPASAAAPALHVCSARGDDANSGTAAAPLRTLPAARDAARRLRAGIDTTTTVDIVLHSTGVHHLAAPLVLDGRDSHTRYIAAPGGDVLVSGGVSLPAAAVSPRAGHAGQFQTNMTALGLSDLGTVLPAPPGSKPSGHGDAAAVLHPQLFINEQSGLLARWPNARNQTSWQWSYTNDCLSSTCSSNCDCSSATINGFSWRTTETNGSGVPPAVKNKWSLEADPYLHGYWQEDWRDGYLPLTGIDAAKNGLLVGKGAQSARGCLFNKVKTGSRYYVFNLLSELDNDGEYFLSRSGPTKGMLYFQPPTGTWPPSQTDTVSPLAGAYVSSAGNLVVLEDGAEHLLFQARLIVYLMWNLLYIVIRTCRAKTYP